MPRGPARFPLPALALVLLFLIGGIVLRSGSKARTPTPSPAPPSSLTLPAIPSSPPAPHAAALRPAPIPDPASPPDPLAALDDQRASGWDAVDLDAVRAALPDNLYWTMSAPTTDPEVLRAREEEQERWNTEYGKVLSNTATDEEIDAYYAYRQRLSSDYAAFAGFILLKYARQLPERDLSLLKLALDMHLRRLEEIPRQIVEAHERHAAHDAARRAWLEDQKAFAGEHADPP